MMGDFHCGQKVCPLRCGARQRFGADLDPGCGSLLVIKIDLFAYEMVNVAAMNGMYLQCI